MKPKDKIKSMFNTPKRQVLASVGIVILGCMVALLLILLKPGVKEVQRKEALALVEVQAVSLVSDRIYIDSDGILDLKFRTSVVAEVAGKIEHISDEFRSGGVFSNNQLLLKIEEADYLTDKYQAELNLAQAELAFNRIEAEKLIVEKEMEEDGIERFSDLAAFKPQFKEAQAQLNFAKSRLALSNLNLQRTEVRAPYQGRVEELLVGVGQYVKKGDKLGEIFSVEVAEIKLAITEKQLSLLDLTALNNKDKTVKALFYVDNKENVVCEGKIVRTAGELDQRTRFFYLIAEIKDPLNIHKKHKQPIIPGTYLKAKVEGRELSNLMKVGAEAIFDTNKVWIVSDDNRLVEKRVKVIQKDGGFAYVQGDFSAEDRVVLTSLKFATEGMLVSIQNEVKS